MAETLFIPATLPPTPLILADSAFLATLVTVEAETKALAVADAATAQTAATLLSRLTTANTALEKARTELNRPFLEISRKINEVAKLTTTRINRSRELLKSRLATWNDAEQARLAEIERQRQAEIRRLEEQARKEREEAERKAAEALKAAAPVAAMDLEFDAPAAEPIKTETERKIDAVRYAPAPIAERPTGVRFVHTLRFRVLDVRALPEDFKITVADEQALRKTFCVGYKEGAPLPTVSGVEFFIEKTAASTGRLS